MDEGRKVNISESDEKCAEYHRDIPDFVPRDELEKCFNLAEQKSQEVVSPPFTFTLTSKFYTLFLLPISVFALALFGGIVPVIVTGNINSVFASPPWQKTFFIFSIITMVLYPIVIFMLVNRNGRITISNDGVELVNMIGIRKTINYVNTIIKDASVNITIYDVSIINDSSKIYCFFYQIFGGINIPFKFINESNNIERAIELLNENSSYCDINNIQGDN